VGTIALYPMSSTALAKQPGVESASVNFATKVAKLTLADSTPGCLAKRFSILAAHEAQVIPSMGRSARADLANGGGSSDPSDGPVGGAPTP